VTSDRIFAPLLFSLAHTLFHTLGGGAMHNLLNPATALLLVGVAAVPSVLGAQASPVRVTIRVEHDAHPVVDASVRSDPVARRTGADGQAVLTLLPGPAFVVVTKIGLKPDTLTLLVPARDTNLSVVLEEDPVEVEEVLVTSTRADRRIEDQPLRVEVLGREEIEEKLLMTPGDITMLLNETGGLRVQNTSPSLGGANIRVQGLRGRYTLVMSDGLPLYGQTGGLGLLQVPPMDLGQVEVIKGAAAALYGSSALGGAVNLISRRPLGEREILLNGTTQGGTDAVLWTSGNRGSWGYTFLGSAHRQSRIDRDGDGWTDVPGYERVVARPRLFLDDGRGRSVFATIGLTIEGREGGTLDDRTAPDGSAYREDLSTTRLDAGTVGRVSLGQGLLLALRGSGMLQRHRHQFGTVGEPDRHGTTFGEAAVSRTGKRGVWVAGVALQSDAYRSASFPAFDYTFTVPSLFAHGEYNLASAVTLAGSARLDAHSEYGTVLNPRFAVLTSLSDRWSARVSAGSGFFAPTPFTEETEVTGLARLLPLAGLRAEHARSASLDIGGGVTRNWELNATLFSSVIDHAVQLRETETEAGGFELINAAGATRTYGGDLLMRWRREPLHMTLTYTYTHSSEPEPTGSARREVALTPRHALGFVGLVEQEGRGRVGIELYYTGQQALEENPYRTTSRPYVIIGALAERRFGSARVFVNFENITDVRQTNYDPLVRPTRAADGRWTTDAWAPLDGRVVNGGVRVVW
jgi:iron complex outermembrane receptor protein